tara:strand:+ start:351 stop:767 length:417 start_codon:yes stop_codon:yes gene_type:complete
MIKEMHEAIKTAFYSKTGSSPNDFTTLVGSRIYDTVGPTDQQSTFCVWRFEQINVAGDFADKEQVVAHVAVLLVTDKSKGVTEHLNILNSLSELRYYSADITSGADRINFSLTSIGGVVLDGKYLTSSTLFRVSSTRQ